MSCTKIFTCILLLVNFTLFAQVEEPTRTEKKTNTSNVKPSKTNQTSGAKALKVSNPVKSAGSRITKSNQPK